MALWGDEGLPESDCDQLETEDSCSRPDSSTGEPIRSMFFLEFFNKENKPENDLSWFTEIVDNVIIKAGRRPIIVTGMSSVPVL